MYGCELRDDGSTNGFHQEGWDGRDYISFDKDNMVWVTPVSWGLITKNKWDQDKARNQQRKGYLEGTCIEWLKKYLKLGEKELRHVAPQVFLSADKASAAKPTQLCCLVTGFYPRDIEVTLLRNGAPIADTCSTGILPNHDGTYQLRRWVQIAPENGANYSCQYEQSEKEGMEILDWARMLPVTVGSSEGTNIRLIVGIVVAAIALIAVVIGAVALKRRGGEYKHSYSSANPVRGVESSSNSSALA
ncbi:class I histocompatibility antigen, F10 alpha chain-like isoform X1 [Heterodontus francisci]